MREYCRAERIADRHVSRARRSNGEEDPLHHTKSAGEPQQSPSEVAQAGIARIIAGKPPQNWAEDAALRQVRDYHS